MMVVLFARRHCLSLLGCRMGQVRRGQGEERDSKVGELDGRKSDLYMRCGKVVAKRRGAERENRNGAAWWTVMVMLLESY